MKDFHIRHHGIVRGLENVPSSPQFEGRFGRMFRTLPAAKFSEDSLKTLAASMVAEFEADPTPVEFNTRKLRILARGAMPMYAPLETIPLPAAAAATCVP